MINKEQAIKHGVNIIDTANLQSDSKQELINNVKDLLPNIVNSDNQIDVKALNDLFDITNTTSNNQGYELTFAGKGLARAKAGENTTLELKIQAEQSKDFDNTNNVIIRGDNIDILKVLYANYHSKIKMIYIDPPYNTKSENFIYNDNFKKNEEELINEFHLNEDTSNFLASVYGTRSHSGWLSFMYPRLMLAKDLLSDDGVIFISIDDNEQANLKIMCDEIFGEDNSLFQITVLCNPKGRSQDKYIANCHEYLVGYSKNALQKGDLNIPKPKEEIENNYKLKDDRGRYRELELRNTHREFGKHNRQNLFFPFYVSLTGDVSLLNSKDASEIFPLWEDGFEGCWTWGIEKATKQLNELVAKKIKGSWKIYRKNYAFDEGGDSLKQVKSLWIEKCFHTEKGQNVFNDLFKSKEKIFQSPKALEVLKQSLLMSSSSNSIILDFFAGSGTTAHAVMQLNAEDGGNRRFILAQLDEEINPKTSKPAYDFCQENGFEPVISSITIERVNRAGDKIKAENPDKNIDIGYKVFSLTERPTVDYNEETKSFNIMNKRNNHMDTLINMLVATCKTLDSKIEEIKKNAIYKAGGEIYIIDIVSEEELSPYNNLKVNIDSLVDFSLEQYLNLNLIKKDNITIIY